jgi:hypothetical protein
MDELSMFQLTGGVVGGDGGARVVAGGFGVGIVGRAWRCWKPQSQPASRNEITIWKCGGWIPV